MDIVIVDDKNHVPPVGRHCVGIDLGTTNTVLAETVVDDDAIQPPQVVAIEQLTQPGMVEGRAQLPSFMYQTHSAEVPTDQLHLPWSKADGDSERSVLGYGARFLGAKTPSRLVASAKSWLSHAEVDRTSAILPWGAPEDVDKISPVDASVAYLRHVIAAWNHHHPADPLEQQKTVITIPASFDPGARELTALAAKAAGFHHVTLLEEPQAALYSWIDQVGDGWRDQLSVGDIVLVVDVGGGTTDLSLIAVGEDDGALRLERIAVGDHILLGGDNMDLALAYQLRVKLANQGTQLKPWQILELTHGCREAKEALLSDPSLESVPIVVPSRGSKLLGKSIRTELTHDEVVTVLMDGFFPVNNIDQHPMVMEQGALQQMGLPYAKDTAITRHLAAFLCRQREAASNVGSSFDTFIHPNKVLFNGGVLKSTPVQNRIMNVLNSWLQADRAVSEATVLNGADHDLAVARGAAYYSALSEGKGMRIRGGLASSFYIGVENAMPAVPGMPPLVDAVCIAPFGMEEATSAALDQRVFGLVVGQPVSFQFWGSTVRRDDVVGTSLDDWEDGELTPLNPIQIELSPEGFKAGEVVPVTLQVNVTEVGTLDISAVSKDASGQEQGRWKVQLDVRQRQDEAPLEESALKATY